MFLTLLQNRGIVPPGPTGSSNAGFVMGAGYRETSFKPVLQRALEARAPKVKPAKPRAAQRAKLIEQQAARLVSNNAPEPQLKALMRDWQQQNPVVPAQARNIDPMELFLAQVLFRMRQMDLLQAIDDEDAIMALLLA